MKLSCQMKIPSAAGAYKQGNESEKLNELFTSFACALTCPSSITRTKLRQRAHTRCLSVAHSLNTNACNCYTSESWNTSKYFLPIYITRSGGGWVVLYHAYFNPPGDLLLHLFCQFHPPADCFVNFILQAVLIEPFFVCWFSSSQGIY